MFLLTFSATNIYIIDMHSKSSSSSVLENVLSTGHLLNGLSEEKQKCNTCKLAYSILSF